MEEETNDPLQGTSEQTNDPLEDTSEQTNDPLEGTSEDANAHVDTEHVAADEAEEESQPNNEMPEASSQDPDLKSDADREAASNPSVPQQIGEGESETVANEEDTKEEDRQQISEGANEVVANDEDSKVESEESQRVESPLPKQDLEGNAAEEPRVPSKAEHADKKPVAKLKKHNISRLRSERTPTRGFLDSDSLALVHSFGFETVRRNNLHRLGPSTLLTSAGNAVLLLDLNNLKQEFLLGIDGGGIGAITVHPSTQWFAVGEKGTNPNVYIYSFPSLELVHVLSNGTERAFSDMRFSNDGKMLATVGSFPDYLLHIWDWEEEAVVLRAKAFSQEVFNVSFSPRFDGILYTSGTGHIRFWKMADTFTGLKLQGEIGKFGAIELSDISAYQEMKDGKVITGSECGNLLLWDGGLVKVEIRCKEGTCHKGMIEVVWLYGDFIVSAGEDGQVKFWDYNAIDLAEPCDEGPFCIIQPMLSYSMRTQHVELSPLSGQPHDALQVQIKTMHLDPAGLYKEWLVQDAGGALWRLPIPVAAETLGSASASMVLNSFSKIQAQRIIEMHAGAVAGVASSPHGPTVASAGHDGTLRLYDTASRSLVFRTAFPQPATTLVWAPQSVDESGALVALGFGDGVVRLVQQCREGWRLRHVFKPHTKAVLHIAFAPDGKHLASGSEDKTLFIMRWDAEYMGDPEHFVQETPGGWKPVGFLKASAPVTCLSWSPDGHRLLACTGADSWVLARGASRGDAAAPGELLEFDLDLVVNRASDLDTTLTFEIDLPRRAFIFEQKVVVAEPPPKKEGEEEEEEETQQQPPPPPPPGRPTTCAYATNTSFFVGFDGEETAGVLYECTFDFKYPIKELPTHSKPITFMSIWPPWQALSDGPCYLLTGARDGTVAIRPMLPRTEANVLSSKAAGLLSKCWRLHVHATDTHVTAAALSHDMSTLLTSGDDGNLFLFSVNNSLHVTALEELASEAGARHLAAMDLAAQSASVALPSLDEVKEPVDITDPKHYSIQQEKIQAEEDRRLQEAEDKKRQMRERVATLRKEFEELLEWNEGLASQEQLSREELELDPELRQILEHEAAHKVQEARKELAWISEKKAIGLAKLQQAFLDPVAVPYIVVTALRTPYTVCSFRTRKLTDEQREKMEALHSRSGDVPSDPTSSREAPGGASGSTMSAGASQTSKAHHAPQPGAGAGATKGASGEESKAGSKLPAGPEGAAGAKGSVNKAEARKELRLQRQKQWAELMGRKPDDKYEDPNDLAAINLAQNKMGDYKLKTDDDYVVPEHLRINADKKRRQMMLLQESVYTIKMGFNDRLLALRDLKKRILTNISADNARIKEINQELGLQGEELWEPKEGPDEWPERLWEIKDEHLDAANKQPSQPKAAAAATKPLPAGKTSGARGEVQRDGKGHAVGGGGGGLVGGPDGPGESEPRSDVEEAELRVRRVELEYEKERRLDKMEQTVAAFDEAVRNLRRERFKLDADLKMTDLSFLVLIQELKLLKDFEKRENLLVSKLEARREEKADIVARISECQDKLTARKAEIDKLNPRQVLAEFMQLVPESNKLHEPLLKIFKKKIKRQKKKVAKQGEEEGEDEEEEEEDDDEDMSDVDDEDEGEEEEEFCPPGCDPSLYDHVCELRDKRLDQEDVVADFTKAVEALKKDKEALVKKEKMIDSALKQCETEIQGFQTFKQQRLNEIDVVVTLKMHQIKCLVDGRLPPDLSHTIVFTNQGLRQLRQRIDELKEEKEELRKDQKQLRREHVTLSKSNKIKEEHLKELEARARDVQKLKFGQEVDLELLERMSINKTAEELKEQLKALDEANVKELKQWKKHLDAAALELATATKHNTEKLERVAELTASQHRLEKELNSTQSRVVTEVGPSKEKIKAEREQLVSLVKLQAREMEALKAEINMLRRKGGHVYTPAPRPPAH